VLNSLRRQGDISVGFFIGGASREEFIVKTRTNVQTQCPPLPWYGNCGVRRIHWRFPHPRWSDT